MLLKVTRFLYLTQCNPQVRFIKCLMVNQVQNNAKISYSEFYIEKECSDMNYL